MRIIAGSARGRKILSVPKDMWVRPISARIRQSLFDILRPRIMGSRFLDLFAGTGAVGLEALSRGAELVLFVDMEAKCLKVIERNLERADWTKKAKVHRGNALAPLSWTLYRAGVEKFDLVFMGPPYVDPAKKPLRYTQTVVDNAAKSDILSADGWIIAQHFKKEPIEAPEGYELFRQSKYGDTVVSFFRRLGRKKSDLSSEPETRPPLEIE